MKMHKEWKFILTALLASISMLPGCGKSSGSSTTGTSVYGAAAAGASSGSCIAIQANYNSGMSFSISGNLQVNPGGSVYGEAYAQALAGGPIAQEYYRADGPGDVINFTLSVSGSTAPVGGVATLSASTLAYISYYYGPNACVAGVAFYNSNPNNSGMVGSPLVLLLGNGQQVLM